jgi:hypothetical protein
VIDLPTMHPRIPMQTRVRFIKTESTLDGTEGVVKGVSSVGIAFTYSVLLDGNIFNPSIGEYVDIVSITGCCLEEV